MRRSLMLVVLILGLLGLALAQKSYTEKILTMPNIWDKPIRWIFKGDEAKSLSMTGEAKRVLFQLKNIQSAGSSQFMLNKRYSDGSSVNVRTDVQGLDIIKINTPILIPIEEEIIKITDIKLVISVDVSSENWQLMYTKPTNKDIELIWNVHNYKAWNIDADTKYIYVAGRIHTFYNFGVAVLNQKDGTEVWSYTEADGDPYEAQVICQDKTHFYVGLFGDDGHYRFRKYKKDFSNNNPPLVWQTTTPPAGWANSEVYNIAVDDKYFYDALQVFTDIEPWLWRWRIEKRDKETGNVISVMDSPVQGDVIDEYVSGLTVYEDAVYATTINIDDTSSLYKLDRETFSTVWVKTVSLYSGDFWEFQGVIVDKNGVYAHGNMNSGDYGYGMIRLDKETGETVWIYDGDGNEAIFNAIDIDSEGRLYGISRYYISPYHCAIHVIDSRTGKLLYIYNPFPSVISYWFDLKIIEKELTVRR